MPAGCYSADCTKLFASSVEFFMFVSYELIIFSFVYSVSDERDRLRDLCEYLLGPIGSQTKTSKTWEEKIMASTDTSFQIVDS